MKKIYSLLAILCTAFVAISCTSEAEVAEEQGYLKLDVKTLTSTITRVTGVPNGYNAKKLYVELRKSDGTVVMQTDDFDNASDFQGTIVLQPGTYTIEAHSANWDGSDSGFGAPYYTGMTTATVEAKKLTTANLTLTQANVKVTVNYDNSFRTYFNSAMTVITSVLDGVAPRNFIMNSTVGAAYFPVGDLNLLVTVTNKSGQSFVQNNKIENVQARDHYIITYKVADAGSMGGVTVHVDDATQSYTYTVEVPRKSSTALQADRVNAWSNFANLTGSVTAKTTDFDATAVTLQWKQQNAADWTTVANANLTNEGDNYSYKLTGLNPQTAYSYRLVYTNGDITVNSNEVSFTTEAQTAIYNGGFENWWYKDNKVWYANEEGINYWDTSNPGSAGLMGASYNVTSRTTEKVHGGTYAAKLQSMYVIIKFAAASLYTGQFVSLDGTKGAKLNWGVPFTARPTALKGFMSYTPGNINRNNTDAEHPLPSTAPSEGSKDFCQIRIALMTEPLQVNNKDMTDPNNGFPNWQTDSRIIAYGELTQNTDDNGQWKEFNIPLEYRSVSIKPSYLILVCSSSMYGDYFYGSDGSVLYLDDFEFVYGDNPTIQ